MEVIDRRLNPKGKSLGNRQRFIRRAKNQIRDAVGRSLRERKVTDADKGEQITIPADGVHEPVFRDDPALGRRHRVLPGNKEFQPGDRIPRPGGKSGGTPRDGSDSGEGDDDFTFTLTRQEFLDLFFEDLELPDMIKNKVSKEVSEQNQRAGLSVSGSPSNINLLQTMRRSLGRRISLGRMGNGRLRALEEEAEALQGKEADGALSVAECERLDELQHELERAALRRKIIPYIDPIDLRFNRFERVPKPISQAVMFCLMDVSGSMNQDMKDLAKRFFMLLHVFLNRRYEDVEVVFIRHTATASEVDEETFFRGRETGGTVVSSAFDEMLRVVGERYPLEDWNIYAAQASDGDNFREDTPRCVEMLETGILPICQYFSYIEVGDVDEIRMLHRPRESDLWRTYTPMIEKHQNFVMRRVAHAGEIFPVFRELFSQDLEKVQ